MNRTASLGLVVVLGFGLSSLAPAQDESRPPPGNTSTSERAVRPSKPVHRWGQRPNESDKKYDKRFRRVLNQTRLDSAKDDHGGLIWKKREVLPVWTCKGHPFIVRSDISREFTAQTAMYLDMLHRGFTKVYAAPFGPVEVHEKIEVIVFRNHEDYLVRKDVDAKQVQDTAGFFHPVAHRLEDRGRRWPALLMRMQMTTEGVELFSEWDKCVLHNLTACAELQLRFGYKRNSCTKLAQPIAGPAWMAAGMGCAFENWDFERSLDTNAEILPMMGRYGAPFRRRFNYSVGTELSYFTQYGLGSGPVFVPRQGKETGSHATAWALAVYLLTADPDGRRHLRRFFEISQHDGFARRVGCCRVVRPEAWQKEYPPKVMREMERKWRAWAEEKIGRRGTLTSAEGAERP